MAYERNKDVKVESKKVDCGAYRIEVATYSYDGGPKKIQLSKLVSSDTSGEKYAPLGRLSKSDIEKIVPVMQKMASAIEDVSIEEPNDN